MQDGAGVTASYCPTGTCSTINRAPVPPVPPVMPVGSNGDRFTEPVATRQLRHDVRQIDDDDVATPTCLHSTSQPVSPVTPTYRLDRLHLAVLELRSRPHGSRRNDIRHSVRYVAPAIFYVIFVCPPTSAGTIRQMIKAKSVRRPTCGCSVEIKC